MKPPAPSLPLKPLAWYGGSWAYSDPDPEDEPSAEAEDPRAAWEERCRGFDPSVFGVGRPPGTGRGLVVGRFQPPHLGHELVVRFALSFARDLSLLVRTSPTDPVPVELRVAWLRELFPSVWVQALEDPSELASADDEGLARHWTQVIRTELLPPDFVFGSDPSAERLAARVGARYMPVDPARRMVPISGTQVRDEPLVHWRFLPPCVRAHYALRVCVVGAEGTGKTTLVRHLARHYGSVGTSEYARTLKEASPAFEWGAADTELIARGQIALEGALARRANRVLFCDTGLLSVELWSERLFGGAPSWLREQTGAGPVSLYLLMETDGPAAGVFPPERELLQQRLGEELERRGLPYVRLSGEWKEREQRAVRAVDALLPAEVRER